MPLREDFDPTAIPRLLPHIVIHDLRQPGRSVLRLVGTRMVERLGLDPTGRDYAEFVHPERRDAAYTALRTVAEQPCAMRVRIQARFDGGHSALAEAIGLPLEAADGSGRFVVFVDEQLSETEWWDRRAQPVQLFDVLEREYFDIGAGVPG